MNDLYWLSKEQLHRIEVYFPISHGVLREDDYRVSLVLSMSSNAAYNGATRRKNTVPIKHYITALSTRTKRRFLTGSSLNSLLCIKFRNFFRLIALTLKLTEHQPVC